MAYYMLQAAFADVSWTAMARKPQDRMEAFRPVVEKAGGKLVGYWFSLGEYDSLVIVEVPDNVSAASLSIAVTAGGAFKALKTTALLTAKEGAEAMKAAASLMQTPEYKASRKPLG
ncbi:MAG TPA: GYD domain-containing protein [Candidatus Binataceae bacterium]|nr:GYD domain-containing protein [Candidatus Binataceae bacterium]